MSTSQNLRALGTLLHTIANQIDNLCDIKTRKQLLDFQNALNHWQADANCPLAQEARALFLAFCIENWDRYMAIPMIERQEGWKEWNHQFPYSGQVPEGLIVNMETILGFLTYHYVGKELPELLKKTFDVLHKVLESIQNEPDVANTYTFWSRYKDEVQRRLTV